VSGSDAMSDTHGDRFAPLDRSERAALKTETRTIGYWSDVWRRFRRNRAGMIGSVILLLIVVFAVIGPSLVHYSYDKVDLTRTYTPPGRTHWFGTDVLGRDIWARIWIGARVSLFIGVVSALSQMVIGILIGSISGLSGGKVDMIIMRAVDVLIAVPFLIWVSLFMLVLKPGIQSIIFAFSLTEWKGLARLVRGEVLRLKETEFVVATKGMGASTWRLIRRHLFPNVLPVVIVSVTFQVTGAIFGEAFLSYIGLGIQPPLTSWGILIASGIGEMRTYPYMLFLPALFISLTMLSLQLIGDGLRDATDPKLRR
jgi:oligopeptide transport system permease protein